MVPFPSQRVGALWLQQKCTSFSPPSLPLSRQKNPKPVPRKEGRKEGGGLRNPSNSLSLFNSAFPTLCPRCLLASDLIDQPISPAISTSFEEEEERRIFHLSLSLSIPVRPSGYIFRARSHLLKFEADGRSRGGAGSLPLGRTDGRTDDDGNANRSFHSSWKKA